MSSKSFSLNVSSLCSIFLLLPPALCHMEMSWPYPIRSKFNPDSVAADIDYSMTSPLSADGSDFPCKGYQNDRPSRPTVRYNAGSTYNVTLAGTATHGGGSCQMSLSYDNGATFRVIKSMIGGCPLEKEYDITIPSYAPAGNALLAWTWQNLIGNREFYMNCAEVEIQSGLTRRRKRSAENAYGQLPYIWRANLEEVSTCATTEGVNPVYPNPGPDVVYADGMSEADVASGKECDVPLPFGPTYRDLGDTSQAENDQAALAITTTLTDPPTTITLPTQADDSAGPTNPSSLSTSTGTVSSAPLTDEGSVSLISAPATDTSSRTTSTPITSASLSTSPLTDAPAPLPTDFNATTSNGSFSTSYTTTTFDTCPDNPGTTPPPVTTTGNTTSNVPSYTTTAPATACTGTSATCPCAEGYQCQLIDTCTWACLGDVPPTTSTSTSSSSSTSATTTPTQTPPADRPPYAGDNPTLYLPCVPGTFLCLDRFNWATCNYSPTSAGDVAEWTYNSPREDRRVADGMECLPNLTAYNDETAEYAQQARTEPGFYRDDQYVRFQG